MALVTQTLQDSRWRTIVKGTFSGTTSASILVNVSDLLGWVTGSKTNLAAVSWSTSSPIELIWTGTTTAPVALHLNGNGIYGGSNGMPAITNLATGGAHLGDLVVTSAAASVGFVVVVCHKVPTSAGTGWTGLATSG